MPEASWKSDTESDQISAVNETVPGLLKLSGDENAGVLCHCKIKSAITGYTVYKFQISNKEDTSLTLQIPAY
jgi:hypothetical protein